jgi:hypothetical protein
VLLPRLNKAYPLKGSQSKARKFKPVPQLNPQALLEVLLSAPLTTQKGLNQIHPKND